MQSCLFFHNKDTAEFLADHQQTNKTGFSCNSTRVSKNNLLTHIFSTANIHHEKVPLLIVINVLAVFRARFSEFQSRYGFNEVERWMEQFPIPVDVVHAVRSLIHSVEAGEFRRLISMSATSFELLGLIYVVKTVLSQ